MTQLINKKKKKKKKARKKLSLEGNIGVLPRAQTLLCIQLCISQQGVFLARRHVPETLGLCVCSAPRAGRVWLQKYLGLDQEAAFWSHSPYQPGRLRFGFQSAPTGFLSGETQTRRCAPGVHLMHLDCLWALSLREPSRASPGTDRFTLRALSYCAKWLTNVNVATE